MKLLYPGPEERAAEDQASSLLAAREALYSNASKGMGTRINTTDFPAPTDIFEHLPLLRTLASKCDHVTEMGSRWMNGSTIALLAAQPKTFVAWDIDPASILSERAALLHSLRGKTNFQPRVGSTLEIEIEETDLLLIDSLHTYAQLHAELYRHGMNDQRVSKVRKYLCFHDTVSFGSKGEDGSEPGLRKAIREFQTQQAFPLWKCIIDRENNNGWTVLAHVRVDDAEFAGLK